MGRYAGVLDAVRRAVTVAWLPSSQKSLPDVRAAVIAVMETTMDNEFDLPPENTIQFWNDGGSVLLFTILRDGAIVRGPGFTTTDEMSLRFWEALQNSLPPTWRQ
jgi:hypothetical protein